MLSRDLIFFYIDALGRSCLGGNLCNIFHGFSRQTIVLMEFMSFVILKLGDRAVLRRS